MNKNVLIGLLLMTFVMMGFTWLNSPSEEEIAEAKAKQEQQIADHQRAEQEAAVKAMTPDSVSDSERIAIVSTIKNIGIQDTITGSVTYASSAVNLTVKDDVIAGSVAAADTVIDVQKLLNNEFENYSLNRSKSAVANLREVISNAAKFQDFARHMAGTEQYVTLQNNVLNLTLSTKGGRIADAMLKEYYSYLNGDTANIHIFRPEHSNYAFTFTTTSQQRFGTDSFYFTPEVLNDSTVIMKLNFANGGYWGIKYTLPQDSYVATMEVVQDKMEPYLPSNTATIEFDVAQNLFRTEEGRTFEERQSSIYYKFVGDSPDELESMSDDSESLNQDVKWLLSRANSSQPCLFPKRVSTLRISLQR